MTSANRIELDLTLLLDRFTLRVAFQTDHHVTGVFGPSGCGKTSLLEVLAGLRSSSRGTVKLGDTVWQDSARGVFLRPEHRGIGYVPQSGLLFPHKTVEQNLRFGSQRARRTGLSRQSVERFFDAVVDLLELAPLLPRRTGMLSGGERQRIALGRALCSAPKLLLLDEPLAALDHGLRYKILPFLRSIREEFETPMVLVSHDPIEVQALCDHLIVLRRGEIIARGAPPDVLTDPNVFPLADERGFENVIPCSTVSSNEAQTVVAVGPPSSGLTLALTNLSGVARRAQFVGIPARDILVATEKPHGLSARNIVPATVGEMHAVGGLVLLKAHLGEGLPRLAVEVSRSACEELNLVPGLSIYLVIKSMSCTLYGASTAPTKAAFAAYPRPPQA